MGVIKINNTDYFKMSDSTVIKRIISGEKELYEILMKRNNQKLYRVIRSYIKETSEIEDIMQNTYIKAYEKLYQFKHTAQFSTWLIRIGINEALARIKTKSKLVNIYDNSETLSSNSILELPGSKQMNPEKEMIRMEAKQILELAIDKLGPKYKTVYMLKEVEGMSILEISDCLNLTKSNIKVRLHRTRLMLKDVLYELSISKDVFEFGSSRCDNLVERVMKAIA